MKNRILPAAGVILAGTLAALACGPWYPDRLLDDGAKALLNSPVSVYERELRRLRPDADPALPRAKLAPDGQQRQQTADADLADLRDALDHPPADAPPLAPEARAALLTAYADIRNTLRDLKAKTDALTLGAIVESVSADPVFLARLHSITPLANLPGEFADYQAGAVAFYLGDQEAARAAWEKLLARPEGERHYRSVWAAYMLGKLSAGEKQSADAIRWFEKTRALAAGGCADSAGLAAASLGWQAQETEDIGAQTKLYLDQLAAGDQTAVASLQAVFRNILDGEVPAEELAKLATNDDARRAATAYIVARTSDQPELSQGWLAAIEAAGVGKTEEADRLAWSAYQNGEFDLTVRWLDRAPSDGLVAMWLRAKLELRAGHIEQANEWLAKVVRLAPADDDSKDLTDDEMNVYAEYAVRSQQRQAKAEWAALQLNRGDFVAALDGLLRTRFWRDAAYVAERVLTTDKLVAYVDARWPEQPSDPPTSPRDQSVYGDRSHDEINDRYGQVLEGEQGLDLRCLLARRLARQGNFDAAVRYFPPVLEQRFKAYAQAWRDGHDAKRPALRRAWALWTAAKIARHEGLELLGTEVEPDWATFGGDFEEEETSVVRARDLKPPQPASATTLEGWTGGEDAIVNNDGSINYRRSRNRQLLPPTAAEQRRLDLHHPPSEDRWHYRYTAADLAWEAALLLPDNDELTARVLCAAGSWLKGKDPATADRFYQAIERRCPETPLGRDAVKRRWFPPNVPEP